MALDVDRIIDSSLSDGQARDRLKIIAGLATIGLIVAAVAGFYVFLAWCEASAYERVTGKRVSVWDAMVLELRVDAAPAKEPRDDE